MQARVRSRCHSEHAESAPQRGAGHAIVPDRPPGNAARCAQWRCRAPPGSAMRSALPAQREAAGAPSAWSQPFTYPSRDHADGATLGRRRRTRRPVPRESRGPGPALSTGKRATTGCRARYCAGSTPRQRGAPRTMALPGSPGERDEVSCSGAEGGRRRAIGVVAAFPVSLARPRRWCDAGPPKADQKAGAGSTGTETETDADADGFP